MPKKTMIASSFNIFQDSPFLAWLTCTKLMEKVKSASMLVSAILKKEPISDKDCLFMKTSKKAVDP